MAVVRKRLLFWLIKAYIQKSGKTFLIFFLLGLIIFFGILFASQYFGKLTPFYKKASIGIVGAYTQDNMPSIIVDQLSKGLTSVQRNDTIKPALASSWEISDNGKTYTFKLKHDQYFNNGKQVTADSVNYNFSDTTIERPDKFTVVFKLKEPYAPFLVTVSRPIFDQGVTGISNYKIEEIKLNGNFVQTLTLVNVKNRLDTMRFQFYPSEDALKMAYLLGEITIARNLTTENYKDTTLSHLSNTKVTKQISNTRLVTLFYNTADKTLSDKILRIALSYALPESYTTGQKAYLPYPPTSIYYNKDLTQRTQDFEHAKLLLGSSGTASGSATIPELHIKVLKKYKPAALSIAATWKKIGIKTSIEEVDSIPDQFQIYLGEFNIPKDPDQYTLWHSGQINNITQYKNLRIDKLLEDGRKTIDLNKRKELYADFQKFLMEDEPASFLYFPYEYEVTRK